MSGFTESIVEQIALAWLESRGRSVKNDVEFASGEPGVSRSNGVYRNVIRSTDAGAPA